MQNLINLNLALKPLNLLRNNKVIVAYKATLFVLNMINIQKNKDNSFMSTNMTDIALELYKEAKSKKWSSMSMKQSREIVSTVFSILSDSIAKEDPVYIRSLGTFNVKEHQTHDLIVPSTKELIKAKIVNIVKFKPSDTIKRKINK